MVRVHPCLPIRCSRSPSCELTFDSHSLNEPDHRHAAGWIESQCACRHARRATSRRRSLRGSQGGAGRRWSTARLVDLTYPLTADASVRIVTDEERPRRCRSYRHSTAHLLAAAVTNLFPGRAVRHRSGDRRRLLLRLRRRSGRSCPRISRRSSRRCSELARAGSGLRAADVAARGGEGVLRRARRAAEGAADRREDRRPGARSPATRSRTRTPSSTSASVRTCRRPAS